MSKSGGEKSKLTPGDFDLRVRERNLHTGILDAKVVEKHLGELVDMDAHCETIELPQPALGDSDPED